MPREQKVSLRRGICADADAVLALKAEAFASSLLRFTIYQDARSVSYLGSAIKAGDLTVTVAELPSGELVGYTQASADAGSWFLGYIAVRAAVRARGVGSQLLASFEADALAQGFSKVELDVTESDEKVVEWYSKNGYEPEERLYHLEMAIRPDGGQDTPLVCAPVVKEAAMGHLERHGFCRIEYSDERCTVVVGLIGEDRCKLLSVSGMTPREAVREVGRLHGRSRHLLVVSGVVNPSDYPDVVDQVAVLRMHKGLVSR